MKIRLTESKLKQIVNETVNKVLKESNYPKTIADGTVAPIPRIKITPKNFIAQTLEKLDICRISLWHAKMGADEHTVFPDYNHKFDGVAEKLEEAYELVNQAYKICFEISKIE